MPPTRAAVALLLLAATVLCFGGGRASSDFDYPAAFNFGDSNSDTGGRIAAGFEPMLPPYGSTFFGGPAGRFCDGRLILDFLSEHPSQLEFIADLLPHLNRIAQTDDS